ncbi:FDLD family class I lanthipeptide [Streptomyces sioyaensis]|uniref:FDLD family class I lanthipeptide n=1 Tax=Streptomyces sioyaensis TaxID=67364 RepID=UPI0037CF23E1
MTAQETELNNTVQDLFDLDLQLISPREAATAAVAQYPTCCSICTTGDSLDPSFWA